MQWWTLIVLIFLYFLQGMPYGIQINFLPILLRGQGVSLANISLFKLLFLPWALKVVWAPFVDRYGTKQRWLVATLFLLSIVCVMTSLITFTDLATLALMLLLQNLLVAVQDIAVDSITVSVLSSGEVHLGNVAQVVGYKLGGMVGGYVYLMIHTLYGHGAVYILMAAAYFMAFYFVSRINFSSINGKSKSDSNPPSAAADDAPSYFQTMISAVKTQGTIWMIGYTLLYKCGDNGSIATTALFLVDKNVSKELTGFYTGVIGSIGNIVGSLVGGYILARTSPYKSSIYTNVLRSVCLLLINAVVYSWTDSATPQLTVLLVTLSILQQFLSGLTSLLTVTWMMSLSQCADSRLQSTHYSTLATSEILGKLAFASVIGSITDRVGYSSSFTVMLMLSIAAAAYTLSASKFLRDVCQTAKHKE